MSEQLRLRGDVASNVAAYTGPSRETVVDTTNNRLVVQDGVTPGGWAAAKLAEVNRVARTAIIGPYAALASDRLIAVTALASNVAVTLPAAAAFQPGARLIIVDETGQASYGKSIPVTPQGSDVLAGAFAPVITSAYGYLEIESNGVGQWTMTDGVGAAGAAASTSSAVSATAAALAFSGQAVLALSQPITPFSVSEPRLKAALRPVIAPVNAQALKSGLIAAVTLTGFAAGRFDGLVLLTTLDGKPAPSALARLLLTLTYIGA